MFESGLLSFYLAASVVIFYVILVVKQKNKDVITEMLPAVRFAHFLHSAIIVCAEHLQTGTGSYGINISLILYSAIGEKRGKWCLACSIDKAAWYSGNKFDE